MRFVLLLGLFALAGCISDNPTPTQLSQNAGQCDQFGYKQGTQAYSDCQLQLAMATTQNNASRRRHIGRALAGLGASSQPRRINCTSQPGIGGVYTSCY